MGSVEFDTRQYDTAQTRGEETWEAYGEEATQSLIDELIADGWHQDRKATLTQSILREWLENSRDGMKMVDVDDKKHAKGTIALQYGAGTVKFRNVRVRTL